MLPFPKCPTCGGEIVQKEVEKLLKGGPNTAVITLKAEVCLHCGERYYSPATTKHFEEIRHKLAAGDISEFEELGHSYKAVA
jgi:YgiT-type zinc finger domain-containing protein